MRNHINRVTIEISDDQKKKLKVLATLCNMTIKDFIIDRTIGREPNEETLKSFNDYKNNIGLSKHNNFEDFWKNINK